jgi:hypothetical protein
MNISKIFNSKHILKLEWKSCSDKNGKTQKIGFVKHNKIYMWPHYRNSKLFHQANNQLNIQND